MAQYPVKTFVSMLALALAALPARAGLFGDVVLGLEFAGFQFAGNTNPLSGGADMSVTRNFTGQEFDFGATEVVLTGPIGMTFETGGRNLPTLDFSLSTNNQPLNYVLTTSSGAQDTTVSGSFLLDATGSMNTFGFYDMRVQISSRQDVTQEGRFQDDVEEQYDFDIGPVDVSGNIFADMLAVFFDPFFKATGTTNIFASFSGRAQLQSDFDTAVAEALAKTDAGLTLSNDELGHLFSLAEANALLNGRSSDLSFLDGILAEGHILDSGANNVPEPSTLVLLLIPTIAIAARRRRR